MKSHKKGQFEELYRQHEAKVYRLCLGYLKGNSALANDLKQEVFIKVWLHWGSFDGKAKRSTWLYRIAVNTSLQELRKAKAFKKAKITALDQLSTADSDNKEEQFRQLYACIDQLNPVNKTIILLELEQVPQTEIAQIIGIQHGALRTRLNRIKNQLTKCVSHENI
ncbi:RNA polymerase sigma factor [Nonlabens xiamenensis]|uniref:RNA polymerase sigma factor n=1 Tax=Nonlabens xiamenensis TaxID=2341043 RepID=UPI000F606176|nr:sigma-70 family RNA polymerase sigma factor [Nonlabens xiamenensis]